MAIGAAGAGRVVRVVTLTILDSRPSTLFVQAKVNPIRSGFATHFYRVWDERQMVSAKCSKITKIDATF
jgi:hypothetical protein